MSITQNSERSDGLQSPSGRFVTARSVVYQEPLGMDLKRDGDGLGFAGVQSADRPYQYFCR